MSLKVRLTIMNFLEFAVWVAYLTSMGGYLAQVGQAENIGWFYSIQGVVSLFMPALVGIIADRWVQGQKMLGICHFLAGAFLLWSEGRRAGFFLNPIQSLYGQCSLFHAYNCFVQFCGILRFGSCRYGYREAFPSNPCVRNRWFYLFHVGG